MLTVWDWSNEPRHFEYPIGTNPLPRTVTIFAALNDSSAFWRGCISSRCVFPPAPPLPRPPFLGWEEISVRWRRCKTNARSLCLGSHTSKTVRRAVKGPRGVRPSDRGANWYVRLRSPTCPPLSPHSPARASLPSLRPRSLGLGGMIGCQTRDRSLNSSSSARFRAARFLPYSRAVKHELLNNILRRLSWETRRRVVTQRGREQTCMSTREFNGEPSFAPTHVKRGALRYVRATRTFEGAHFRQEWFRHNANNPVIYFVAA